MLRCHKSGREASLILEKQTELLYRGFLPSAAGTVLVSVFFAAAMWGRAGTELLPEWLVSVWMITLMRGLLTWRFFRSRPAVGELQPWILLFAVGAAGAGAIWGLTAYLFISGSDVVATILVIFIIAGVSSASLVVLAPIVYVVDTFLLTALVPLSLRLFQMNDSAYVFMSAIVLIYLVVLLMSSWNSYKTIWKTVQTSMVNEQLKAAITREKALAEEREKTVARLIHLERENELFRNMVERAGDFVITVHDISQRGRIVYANDAACKHFGVDHKTLLTLAPQDFVPEYDVAEMEMVKTRLEAGVSISFESVHRVAGGELVPVEVSLHPLVQNGKLLCVTYTHDIRGRKEIEAKRLQYEAALARHEAEERYRDLVEALPDFIVRLDTEARHLYISPQALQGVNRDESEFLGKTAVESGITGSRKRDRRLYEATMQTIKSGKEHVYEDWWTIANRRKCFEIRHIPEKDDSGKVVSVLGITRDITKRARIDDTLNFVARRGWSQDGESFLTGLARYLGKMLSMDYVIIDRLVGTPDEAETVALYARGEILPNMRYSLKGTPCDNVMNAKQCCYPENVRQQFPEDNMLAEMNINSYIGMPLWDSAGNTIGLIAVMDSRQITDTTTITGILQLVATRAAAELERERWEHKLTAREQEYRTLLDNSPDIIVRYDTECRRTYSNPAHARLLNRPVSLGTTPLEDWGLNTDQDAVQEYQSHLKRIMDTAETDDWELHWLDKNGDPACALVRGTPELDEGGNVISVLVFGRDISERKQLEAAMNAREQEFRALVENSPEFVTRFDSECRRIYANPTLDKAMDARSILGKSPVECYPGNKEAEAYESLIRQTLKSGEENQCVFNFAGKDGHEYCLDIRIVPERSAAGEIIGVLAIGRDFSDRLLLEEELRRQASYDALTGLPNRWLFGDRLQDEITKAWREDSNVALLFIDLDRFKEVNDMLGHEIGDQLLQEAARRIKTCLRESDTIARLGGDEFVAILPGVQDVAHLGSVAQKIIDVITQSFHFNEHSTYISASIGIASYPMDADNAKTLISCADQAMYSAKERGRNGFSFFTASMQAQAESRLRMGNDLRGALSQQQFHLHFQPIIDTSTGLVVKAETLLRWKHPEHGMVPPDKFIPVAEETGLIHELGDWVFREAVKTARLWRKQCNNSLIQISVNISPRQFMRGCFIEPWLGHLAEIGLPAECMVIEITEGLLLGDQPGIQERLGRLRRAGIQVALDDFGTGYSSMAYLKKFNIDYLKIDRSFVRDLALDESDRAIAETIVIMANRLGLKTIAEGVETIEQHDILAAVGCEYMQGYLYARPMPTEEFLEFIASENMDVNETVSIKG